MIQWIGVMYGWMRRLVPNDEIEGIFIIMDCMFIYFRLVCRLVSDIYIAAGYKKTIRI